MECPEKQGSVFHVITTAKPARQWAPCSECLSRSHKVATYRGNAHPEQNQCDTPLSQPRWGMAKDCASTPRQAKEQASVLSSASKCSYCSDSVRAMHVYWACSLPAAIFSCIASSMRGKLPWLASYTLHVNEAWAFPPHQAILPDTPELLASEQHAQQEAHRSGQLVRSGCPRTPTGIPQSGVRSAPFRQR